ncbi:MAG: sulfatase-like hydrolase/transferase [Alphaproteobacteria bacterium]|nr:sulfatase-like hydrolase/transferase [Alphaproteobacteria bacterium]
MPTLSATLLLACSNGGDPAPASDPAPPPPPAPQVVEDRQTAPAPDILLVVLDTVRQDHAMADDPTGAPWMPTLRRISDEGMLFTEAMSTGSWTYPTHASLLTGAQIYTHRANGDQGRYLQISSDVPDLVTLLSEQAGYATGLVSANPNPGQLDLPWDISEVHPYRDDGAIHGDGEALASWTRVSRQLVALERPTFLLLNLMEAHAPQRFTSDCAPFLEPHQRAWFDSSLPETRPAWAKTVLAQTTLRINDALLDGLSDDPDATRATLRAGGFIDDEHRPTDAFLALASTRQASVPLGTRDALTDRALLYRLAVLAQKEPGLDPYAEKERDALATEPEAVDLYGRLYDCSLRTLDGELARVLDEWWALDHPHGQVILVTADHGELIGEHGRMLHGGTPHRELTHVPLVVHGDGIPALLRDDPVQSHDVAPTILQLAGVERPEMDARSLLGEGAADRVRIATSWVPDASDEVLAIEQWTLWRRNAGPAMEPRLFDDQAWSHPVDAPDRLAALQALAASRIPRFEPFVYDDVAQDAASLEALRALGYVE